MEYLSIFLFFIVEIILFISLVLYSKYVNINRNYFVGFRTRLALKNDETFNYANKLFNNYNILIIKKLLFLSVSFFIISLIYPDFFYIIYLPIFILIIAYFIIAYKINKMLKIKFNL